LKLFINLGILFELDEVTGLKKILNFFFGVWVFYVLKEMSSQDTWVKAYFFKWTEVVVPKDLDFGYDVVDVYLKRGSVLHHYWIKGLQLDFEFNYVTGE